WSPAFCGRLTNRTRGSPISRITSAVSSVHASPTTHISHSENVWRRTDSMANRSTLLRLYVAVTTETTGGLSKFAIYLDDLTSSLRIAGYLEKMQTVCDYLQLI